MIIKYLRNVAFHSPLTWRKCSEVKRCSQMLFQTLTRTFSDSGTQHVVCRLKSRGLVQVKGVDTLPFLQGLVSNDVTLLEQQTKSLYAMLLNVQGRVQYDLILYNITRPDEEPTLLIECDHSLVEEFIKDIRKYKIRKKVSLEPVNNLAVFATLGQPSALPLTDNDVIIHTADPRVPHFGSRLIARVEREGRDESLYHENRVKWGIPEGPEDLPFGNCLPLECNLVYMNGVSFTKGCYLGQELTARTHHTGVIRKRIMPVLFTEPPGEIEPGENVVNEKNKNVGKFRSCAGQYGLGLLRIADVKGELSVKTRSGLSVKMTALQPNWWPSE